MDLIRILYKIQHQTAKIEVWEIFARHAVNSKSGPEAEQAEQLADMFSSLRENLFDASEDCLEASSDALHFEIALLQDALISTTNFIIQINNALPSADVSTLPVKELFVGIVSELLALNTELDAIRSSAPQQSSSCGPAHDTSDQSYKNLLGKCMGDADMAERLIQYEYQKRGLAREDAIDAAITRLEMDNARS